MLDKWYPQYEKALQGTTGSADRYQIETNWQTTLTNYAAQNPVWGDYWNEDASTTIGGGKRGQLINNMKKLLASPEAPRTEVADMTRTLISAYEAYESTYGSNQLAGESNTDLTSTWKANLYATVAAHPELTNVVTGLFLSASQLDRSGSGHRDGRKSGQPRNLYGSVMEERTVTPRRRLWQRLRLPLQRPRPRLIRH